MGLPVVSGDLIRDVCERLAELAPSLDVAVIRRLEAETRVSYGGDSVYIARTGTKAEKQAAVERIRPGVPVAQQAAELGLSRMTIYRALGKRLGESKRFRK